MIRLYIEADEKIKLNTDITKYNHNKCILNDAITCTVTETVDGIFDLDLVYPLNDTKNISKYLTRGNVIKCPISQTDSRGEQLFTIKKINPSTKDNRITIYAQAKARRDLDFNMVIGMRTTGTQTRKQACQMLLNACVEPHNYVIGSLDTNTNTSVNLGLDEATGNVINFLDINGLSPRTGFLSDSENSIFKAFGGEIIYNNFELNMVDERGTGNTILIKSGKNLEDLQQEIDDTDLENLATAILPCSADGYYLPNSEIIYSPNVATLGKIFKRIVFDDVTAFDDTQASINVVYEQLRERVQKKYDGGMDKLKINNTINFIQLANTEEYKNYASLERCEIGNNVIVRYYKRDSQDIFIEATGRVVKIKFNVLKNKIEEVEVGERKKKSIVDTINGATNNVSNVNNKANKNTAKIKKAKKEASDAISATNSHVVTVEQKADQVVIDVKDLSKDTEAKFVVQDEAIEARVKNTTYNSYIIETADKIDAKVAKGTEFSTELAQEANQVVITSAIAGETDMNVIFNHDGQTIKNGAFQIQGSSGDTIFRANTDGSVGLKDLDMRNANLDKYSAFYATLYSMPDVALRNMSCSTLYVGGDSLETIIHDYLVDVHLL